MLKIKYNFVINHDVAMTVFKNPVDSSNKEKAFDILTFFTGGSFVLSDEKGTVYNIMDYDLLGSCVCPDGMVYILKMDLDQIKPKLKLDSTLRTKPILTSDIPINHAFFEAFTNFFMKNFIARQNIIGSDILKFVPDPDLVVTKSDDIFKYMKSIYLTEKFVQANEDFINKKFNIPEPFDPENEEVSDDFILDNYIGLRDSDTGKINAIKFEWDGAVLEREDIPNLFDRIVDVLELNPDQAEILIKKDFM